MPKNFYPCMSVAEGENGDLLFDLYLDPAQEHGLRDAKQEQRMIALMVQLMQENDAPPEQYERVGLKQPTEYKGRKKE